MEVTVFDEKMSSKSLLHLILRWQPARRWRNLCNFAVQFKYSIYTDAIKLKLVPEEVTDAQASFIYAEDAYFAKNKRSR